MAKDSRRGGNSSATGGSKALHDKTNHYGRNQYKKRAHSEYSDGEIEKTDPKRVRQEDSNPNLSKLGRPNRLLSRQPAMNTSKNPFAPGSRATTGVFGAPSAPKNPFAPAPAARATTNGFGQPSAPNNPFAPVPRATSGVFGTPPALKNPFTPAPAPTPRATNGVFGKSSASKPEIPEDRVTSESLEHKIQTVLSRERISKPTQPSVDVKQNLAAWDAYAKSYRAYRSKYRDALIRAKLIDDPDVPKRLQDAIDFKGTCETMCPEIETAERMSERRCDPLEKEYLGNGSFAESPSAQLMVKKLARSAAGQDAPLPNEVRTVKALRKTLDYLIDDLLANMDLPSVHGFIWDRTRAIRRDFVFHSHMTDSEMLDRAYVLENIARFHVVALHQMSKPDVKQADFVEQQEHEQLAKTLTSLNHAYEDCNARKIKCDNEAEFRAYNLLYNRRDPDALARAQDLGWKFWGESDEFQIAVSLVEAYQSTWDTHGPLKNPATLGDTQLDITLNAFSKFFTIVEDSTCSYTMACFAEISFNDIRKSVIQTIIKSNRRQKGFATDWTLTRLNEFLRFDDEEDIVPWGEKHGLHFESRDGEEYLSFEKTALRDAWPAVPQQYSYELVERKRGDHTLSELVHTTVYGDPYEEEDYFNNEEEEEESLFIDGPLASDSLPESDDVDLQNESTPPTAGNEQAASIFDRFGTPNVAEPTPAPVESPQAVSIFERFGTPQAAAINMFPSSSSNDSTTPKEAVPSVVSERSEKVAIPAKPLFSFLSQPSVPSTTIDTEEASAQAQTQPETIQQAPVPEQQTTHSPASNAIAMQFPSQGPLFGTITQAPITCSSQEKLTLANTTVPEASSLVVETATPVPTKPPKIHRVAEWVFNGDDGLRDEFMAHELDKLLGPVWSSFQAEQARIAEEMAREQARIEADQFRYQSLATRYVRYWRVAARKLGQIRRGRENRELRRQLAESKRAEKAAEKANLVEDFKATTTAKRRESRERRESLESLLQDSGIMDGVHDKAQAIRKVVLAEYDEQLRAKIRGEVLNIMEEEGRRSSKKRPRSEQSSTNLGSSGHKRGRSDNPLARSLLSDPTYLSGESRMHLIPNYVDRFEPRRQISGVQTDYFRLKARGITTLPNGTPLAKSAVKDVLHQKRSSMDGISKPSAAHHSKVQAWARDVPAQAVVESEKAYDEEWDVINRVKGALVKKETNSKKKTALDDEDMKLLAAAKKFRESMTEGEEFYREYNQRSLKGKGRSTS